MWRAGLLVVLVVGCGIAHAQQNCPWLTQGTAASLLGGAVTASVRVAGAEGSCEFMREDGSLRLKIAVGHEQSKECVAGEPLTGIGEESVRCVEDAGGEHREKIRGRVRSVFFLLTMTAHGGRTSLRSALEQVGEEVAGSLF